MNVKKIVVTEEQLNITGATLLSKEEAETLLTPEERTYNDSWWLRSPGCKNLSAEYISNDGIIDYISIYYVYLGVRPALVLSDISNTNFKVGDIFELSGYKFKIISNTLAWMYEDNIGYHYFDIYTNVYEKSSVKKVVDNWFKYVMAEA